MQLSKARSLSVADGGSSSGCSPLNTVRFTKCGAYCVTAGDDRTVRLWNPHKSTPEKQDVGLLIKAYGGQHAHAILDVAIAHDNARFVSAGVDKSMFVYDVVSGLVIRRIQGHEQRVNAVALNAQSTVLMSASYDQTVSLWDLRSNMRDPIQRLSDFKDSVTSLAVTDCVILAGSIDGCLRSYDLRQGLLNVDSFGTGESITCVRNTNDSRCALSMCMSAVHASDALTTPRTARGSGALRLTDAASGKLLRSYSGHAHASFKSECAVLSDDVHIAAGSEDGSVVMWGVVDGAVRARAQGAHGRGVSSLSCHPSRPLLLSAGYDGAAFLWELRQGE